MEQDMKESGTLRQIKGTEKEFSFGKMAHFMKGIGKMIKQTDKED